MPERLVRKTWLSGRLHPNASKITGMVCGVRVEEVEDELMRKIRMLDMLVDELAKGWAMGKILRAKRRVSAAGSGESTAATKNGVRFRLCAPAKSG